MRQLQDRHDGGGTHRFSSERLKWRKASLEEHEMEYLYDDGEFFYFMNTETFEQMHLTKGTAGRRDVFFSDPFDQAGR